MSPLETQKLLHATVKLDFIASIAGTLPRTTHFPILIALVGKEVCALQIQQ